MEIERIKNIVAALDTVRNSSCGTRVTIDNTDWLSDIDLDEIDQLYVKFDALFQEHQDSCIQELGPPTYTDTDNRELVDAWYPEARRLSLWQQGDGNIFLALVHQDRETPICLELGSISQTEIDELEPYPDE